MEALKIVPFILVQELVFFVVFASDKHSISSNSAFFKTRDNTRLKGHVVKKLPSSSLMSCSHWCLRDSWCTSVNFIKPSEENKKGVCELNKHGDIDESSNHDVDYQRGVTFSMLVKEHHLPCAGGPTGPRCQYGNSHF
ncbi:uncharacterized protein LOC111345032 [Stylophora pistillata]|uniref:uncharacterized protein LOC111345032 n=1 Tax=Stylophora pistillata TaxID=50429 RepID=UPI000C051AE7|nr:uncharacterized protein LOC111345032 [Stylophora pistillata]